jgi:predicted secreted protein
MTQEDYLAHHGILGQKWGVRRYQNPDGSLTNAGKKRYAKSLSAYLDRKEAQKDISSHLGSIHNKEALKKAASDYKSKTKALSEYEKSEEFRGYEKNVQTKAYNKTYKYLEDNDPDSLREMIKANGGKKTGLNAYHDFDTVMDSFIDDEYESRRNTKMDSLYSDWDKARQTYQKECDIAANDIIGHYGNTKLKNIPPHASGYYNINDLINNAVDDKYRVYN